MVRFILSCGPYGPVLVILSAVVLVLSIKKVIDLYSVRSQEVKRLDRGLHSILFWGGFAGVLGLLGQFSAVYKSLSVIISAPAIDPKRVMLGMAESFHTTLFRLTICLISGLIWFGLNARYKSLINRMDGSA